MDTGHRLIEWAHSPVAQFLMLALVLAWLPYGRIRRWWDRRGSGDGTGTSK
jgi:hypothetical protein